MKRLNSFQHLFFWKQRNTLSSVSLRHVPCVTLEQQTQSMTHILRPTPRHSRIAYTNLHTQREAAVSVYLSVALVIKAPLSIIFCLKSSIRIISISITNKKPLPNSNSVRQPQEKAEWHQHTKTHAYKLTQTFIIDAKRNDKHEKKRRKKPWIVLYCPEN